MGIEEFLLDRAKVEERKKRNNEIAKNLKKAGVDIKIISEATGLPVEEIRKL